MDWQLDVDWDFTNIAVGFKVDLSFSQMETIADILTHTIFIAHGFSLEEVSSCSFKGPF